MAAPIFPVDGAPDVQPGPSAPRESAVPEQVRVMVDVGEQSIEKVLLARRRLAVIMDSLIPTLQENFPDKDFETDGSWTLAKEGGESLSLRKSLHDSGVCDGDRLILKAQFTDQKYKPIIEDTADAIQEWCRRRFKNFSADTARSLAVVGLVLSALAVSGLLLRAWAQSSSIIWWLPPSLLLSIISGWAALSARNTWKSVQVAYALTLGTMPLLFTTGFVLVPPDGGADGRFTAANVLTGSVLVAIGSAVLGRALKLGAAALTAVCSSAIVATIASILFAYTPLEKPAVPAIGVMGGLLLAWRARSWARSLAGIKTDALPPPGEAIDRSELSGLEVDTFDDESTTELARSDRDTIVERWAMNSSKIVTGLYLTAAGTSTISALSLIQAHTRYYWGEVAIAFLSALILVLRARTRDDRVHASIFYIAGFITAVGSFYVVENTLDSNVGRLALIVIAIITLAAFSVAGLKLPGRTITALSAKKLQFAHSTAIAVTILLALWVTRLFAFLRELDLSFLK